MGRGFERHSLYFTKCRRAICFSIIKSLLLRVYSERSLYNKQTLRALENYPSILNFLLQFSFIHLYDSLYVIKVLSYFKSIFISQFKISIF